MPTLNNQYFKSNVDFIQFKELLIIHFPNFNINNDSYLRFVYDNVTPGITGKVSFIKKCSLFFKHQRNGKGVSKISKSYWISMGWSDSDSKSKVSDLQKARSVLVLDYWLSKGFTEEAAKEKIKEYQSNNSKKRYEKYTKEELRDQSVWSKQHWLNKGFSESDAEYEVSKRNYAKREFWNSGAEYEEIKKIIGKKTSAYIKENPEKYKSFFGTTSKEEIIFFSDLIKHNPLILHKDFIINVKESKELNQGIIKYDGYLKTDLGIILIEYDGLYWHNQAYDEIKDRLALEIRSDILGIIRISCKHYKTNRQKTLKLIKHGIKKIKSKESNRIKIY
jgi:hypothetical protein